MTARFKRGLKNAGLQPFHFHDLRHYAASIMHALNVPDQYIIQQGGWKSNRVLKEIYQTALSDYQKIFFTETSQHFTEINGGMQHAEEGNATRNATQNPEMP
ncbi:MAG: tyrosine-type recombinase/integrase [Lachnospiraceae bacterium]